MKEEEKKNLKNKKKSRKTAFTLIELLAVIIILGILMVIAVPAVTKYINGSKKTGYLSSAKSIVNGTMAMTNSEIPEMKDQNTTYYIPASYVQSNKEIGSPYGDFTKAYIGVINDGDRYRYFWISNDSSGQGIKTLTEVGALDPDKIESNVTDQEIIDTIESTGIENREKILILGDNGEWEHEYSASYTVTPKGKVEKLDLINGEFIPGIDFNTKIKILAGATGNVNPGTLDQNIQYIRRSTEEPTSQNKQTRNLVSTSTSEVPIYAWFDNGTLYWWTEDVAPNMNETAEVMFYNLDSLKEIDLEDIKTDNTRNMSWMFGLANSLVTLDVSHFDTSSATTMEAMFFGSQQSKLETIIGLENFDTSNVTDMNRMFAGLGVLKSLNLSSFDTSNVINMGAMFANCQTIESLDLSNFNTSNVRIMSAMFNSMSNLKSINLSSFNTSSVTTMNSMFLNCVELKSLNLSNFNTINVTNMASMFANCQNLMSLNVSSFNTINVTDMGSMFANCQKLPTLNVSNFNTSNVTNMYYMFGGCFELRSLNVSNFNTSKVTDMQGMFGELRKITTLDLSNFNTSKVTDMNLMFVHCAELVTLNISSFNTANVTNMYAMFDENPKLRTLDVSSFNTAKVTNMEYMFACDNVSNCQLSSITGLENFNTSNVTSMRFMFFNQRNIRTLDLSSFSTPKLKNTHGMFAATDFTTIYASTNFNVSGVTNSDRMFSKTYGTYVASDEYVLTGGAGTAYDGVHKDKEYARIDDPTNNKPGYFTLKIS